MVKAKVERFKRIQVADMLTQERAALSCGCCIFVGRDELGTVVTAAQPCSPEHEVVTDRSSGVLREMTVRSGRLLVDACVIALTQAAREVGT